MQLRDLAIGATVSMTLLGLAIADYIIVETPPSLVVEQPATNTRTGTGTIAASSSSARSSAIVRKGRSTKKQTLSSVADIIQTFGFDGVQTTEPSLLRTLGRVTDAHETVLLRDGDRAFFLSWVESDDVKTIFSLVQQALQEQFSPRLAGLINETRRPADGPPVDFLTFTDPAISQERIVFLRVRTRLYELHIAPLGQAIADALIAALSA